MATRIAILGGGPGGYVAALRAANGDAEVYLVEMANLGGTCLNWGCIPSKIMKHSAEAYDRMQKNLIPGLHCGGGLSFDLPGLMEHKEKVLGSQRKGIAALLNRAGVQVIQGRGRIAGPGRLLIEMNDAKEGAAEEELVWDKLIIATGTVPRELPALVFDHEHILSSDDLLSLERIPESICIVGGGVIGAEFAFILNALGTEVTVVEALDRILPLPGVDASVSTLIQREMKKRKIQVYLNTLVRDAEKDGKGGLKIGLRPAATDEANEAVGEKRRRKKVPESLGAERLALSVGRRPLTKRLGLETLALTTDEQGFIPVNEKMESSVADVYAIGDILGPEKVMLAHAASHEGLVAADNALGADTVMDYTSIPNAIFTMPESASVGMSEAEARASGIAYAATSVQFRSLGKAQAIGEISGELKLVYDEAEGRLLGVQMCGAHATDLIAEASLALSKGLTVADLAHAVHAHPTLSEIFMEAGMKALGKPIHG